MSSVALPPEGDARVVDRRLAVALSVVLCLLVSAVAWFVWSATARSSASFADTEELADNRLGAATLDIEVGTIGTPLSAGNLAPGDSISGQVDIVNVGSLPLVLSARLNPGSNALSTALQFTAWTVAERCAPDDLETGRAERVLLGGAGGATIDLTGSAPLRLAPADALTMCLGAELPITTGDEAQGQTAIAELVLDAVHDLESDAAPADAGDPTGATAP